jgi:hypothetical protein
MERASRLAARPARKGGRPNACFVVASAEALPRELDGRADEVRLHLPWGSLLRGFAHADRAIVEPLARICAPGARVIALLSAIDRDGLGIRLPDDIEAAVSGYAEVGFVSRGLRPATREDVRAIGSTWTKRLSLGREREAFVVRLDRR